jgi:hypothetical protein
MLMVTALLAATYSFLALTLVASMSGAPNYALDRAQYNAHLWTSALAVSVLCAVACVVFLASTRRRPA